MDDKRVKTQAELIDHHVQVIDLATLIVNGESLGFDMTFMRMYLAALRVKIGFFRDLLRLMERYAE